MTADTALASLSSKIQSLDLDADEAAALSIIVQRAIDADDSEVEGFGTHIGSLGFDTKPHVGFKGSDEELAFKGSDEELQALLEWSTRQR